MKMNRIYVGLAAGVLVMAGATALRAAAIDENFESYGITGAPDGSGMYGSFVDQNDHWQNMTDGNGVIVQDTTSANGTKVLEVSNTDKLRGVRTVPNTFDALDGKIILLADLQAPESGYIAINFADPTSGSKRFMARMGSVGLQVENSGTFVSLKDNDDQDVGKNDLTVGHWYRFQATLHVSPDTGNDTFDLTVTDLTTNTQTGTLSGQLSNNPASLGEIYLYASSGNTVRFDNISYKAVPEPASGSLLLLGVGGLLMRRRK